jgi:hypothetical protein
MTSPDRTWRISAEHRREARGRERRIGVVRLCREACGHQQK